MTFLHYIFFLYTVFILDMLTDDVWAYQTKASNLYSVLNFYSNIYSYQWVDQEIAHVISYFRNFRQNRKAEIYKTWVYAPNENYA